MITLSIVQGIVSTLKSIEEDFYYCQSILLVELRWWCLNTIQNYFSRSLVVALSAPRDHHHDDHHDHHDNNPDHHGDGHNGSDHYDDEL